MEITSQMPKRYELLTKQNTRFLARARHRHITDIKLLTCEDNIEFDVI